MSSQVQAKIGLDASKFEQGMRAIERTVKAVDMQVKAVSSTFDKFGNKTDSLKVAAEGLSKKIELQKEKVQSLQEAYEKTIVKKGADAVATQKLGQRLDSATISLNKMEMNLKALKNELALQPTFLDKVSNSLDKLINKTKSIGPALSSTGKKLTAFVTGPLAAVTAAGIKYNAEMQTYTTRLKTLLGSAEEAQKTLDQIKKDAASTPFDVAGLTQANSLLISAGLNADDSRNTILALGDAISASGGGNEELQRMAVNLQQVKNIGKATSLDIKQFAFAGIDVYGILSDYTGKTKNELQDMDITWDMLNGSIIKASSEGGRYFGAMQEQSETISGKISTLKDNFSAFAGNMTSNFIPAINKVLDFSSKLLNTFNNLSKENQNSITDFLMFAAATGPVLIGMGKTVTAISKVTIATNTFSKAVKSGFGSSLVSIENFKNSSAVKLNVAKNNFEKFKNSGSTIGNFFKKESDLGDKFVSKVTTPFKKLSAIVTNPIKKFVTTVKMPIRNMTLSEDWNKSVNPLINSIKSFGGKIANVGKQSLGGCTKLAGIALKLVGPAAIFGILLAGLGMVEGKYGEQINKMVQMAVQKGPTIITKLVEGIVSKIPELVNQGVDLLLKFVDVFTVNFPILIQGAITIITALANGIATNLDRIIPAIIQVIFTIMNAIVDNLPAILDAGLQILMALVDGVVNNIDAIVDMTIQLILKIIEMIIQNLPKIIEAGIKIIVALIEGLAKAIPQIVAAIPQIVEAIFKAMGEINWADLGRNIINGLIDGLKAMKNMVTDTLTSIASGAINAFKKMFGINSPSRLFFGFGQNTMQGYIDAVVGKTSTVIYTMKNIATKAANAFTPEINARVNTKNLALGKNAGTITNNKNNNKTTNNDNSQTNLNIGTVVVRNDKDIEKLNKEFAKQNKKKKKARGGN
ncbi:MAG: tape measure protein [Clostridia bacterium]